MWKLKFKLMRRFQHAAVEFIRETKRCALYIDMGLGKTIISLTAIMQLCDELNVRRVLVFGPPNVVNSVWDEEVRAWEHTHNRLTCTIIKGTAEQRLKKLKSASDIHLISMDLAAWLETSGADLSQYDMVIIDESSMLKDQSTKRWRAMRNMVVNKYEYLVELTGTPAANGLHQLWPQIYLLDAGERLMHTLTAFRERWFDVHRDGTGYSPKVTPEEGKVPADHWAERAIRDRIADICFTLRDADYAELPPRINRTVDVELPPEKLKAYRKFEREYVMQMSETEVVHTVSAAGMATKLMQLSNGVVYSAPDAEGVRKEHFFHDEKIKALRGIVEEAQGEPILVAYTFKTDVKAILAAFPDAVLFNKTPQMIADWNAGKIQMMLVHPKSAGHGLNLQFGGSIAVWYGLTYSLELYQQLNKRLHRPGQTRTTVIHHLVCKKTIDEIIMAVLAKKDATQENLLNAMRRFIADEFDLEASNDTELELEVA